MDSVLGAFAQGFNPVEWQWRTTDERHLAVAAQAAIIEVAKAPPTRVADREACMFLLDQAVGCWLACMFKDDNNDAISSMLLNLATIEDEQSAANAHRILASFKVPLGPHEWDSAWSFHDRLMFVLGCFAHGRASVDPSLVYGWATSTCRDLAHALVKADRAEGYWVRTGLVCDTLKAMGRLNTCAPLEECCADRIWQVKRIGTLMCRVYE